MTKNATIRCQIDKNDKDEVEVVLKDIGLTLSSAIRIFMKQVILHNGIPFEVKVPNDETCETLKDGHFLGDKSFADTSALLDDLGIRKK